MNHYLNLLKLREIASRKSPGLIQKAKVYLAGRKAPDGVKIHQGPRGKPYYMSEDLKALKESKKKEAPKKEEESGEKKKRLPAFRKQEDGSVMHRTKDGQHGPGAYRIESKDGEHHLTFEGKDGDVKSLGKHADIKELKRMVAGFKEGNLEPELKKRVKWDTATKLKETVENRKYFKVQVGKKLIPEKVISIADLHIKVIPYSEEGKLGYTLWQEHEGGGSSTLTDNDLGKFIRYRAIAEAQKTDRMITRIENKIEKIHADLNNSKTYQEQRGRIERLSENIEWRLKDLERYKTDPNPFMESIDKDQIHHYNLEMAELVSKMIGEGTDYIKAHQKIKELKEKKETLKKIRSDNIRNKIFEFLPSNQRAPICIDQKDWSETPIQTTKEQVDHFVKIITPYMPKRSQECKLTLIVDPDKTDRSNCMNGGGESYVRLNNGDHLFNWVSIHEVGHALEYQYNNISANCSEFYKYRTEGGDRRPLKEVNQSYEEDEVYIPDEFTEPYCGKYYSSYGSSELMSMGLQKLFQDPGRFAMEDGEYFDMVITSLYGDFWRVDGYHI
ncbi:MAG: hypothetical protein BWY45_03061 [Euryarchaeota archaeon ADurb.Bin294]|nr:MAG: hypothetical protein BWY45_03061 [Euryarchaeota archaeon ADurb.Bin294]